MTALTKRATARCLCVRRHSPTVTGAALELHHILPRMYGGGDALENLVWLCATAHNVVHIRLRTGLGGNAYHRRIADAGAAAVLAAHGYPSAP